MASNDTSLRFVPHKFESRSGILLLTLPGDYQVGVRAAGWTDGLGRARASLFTPVLSDRRLIVGVALDASGWVQVAVQPAFRDVISGHFSVEPDNAATDLLRSDSPEDRLIGLLAAVQQIFEIEDLTNGYMSYEGNQRSEVSEISSLLAADERRLADQWLADGNGIAVYHLRYPAPGQRPFIFCGYGTGAMLDCEEPPQWISVPGDSPDRAFLIGHFRGSTLP